MRKLSDRRFVLTSLWLATAVALIDCPFAIAAVYKCVGADGALTFSDSPCPIKSEQPAPQSATDAPALGAARGVPVVPADSVAPVSSLDRKIHELLLLTQLSARESPGLAEVARTLVPRVDSNLQSSLQDPRWAPLSRMIQADIRADMPELGHSFADADQTLVRTLASRVQEADVDAVSAFFRSPTGISYLQFQGEMRTVYAAAVRSVLGHLAAQTPIAQGNAGSAVVKTRLALVTLGVDAASLLQAQDSAHNVRDPAPYAADGIRPEQIVAVQGSMLDEVAAKYDTSLAAFQSFSQSPATRHFYSVVAQPVAAKTAQVDAAMKEFGSKEEEKFGKRWKVAYQRGIYAVAVIPGTSLGVSAAGASGLTPLIRYARYTSPRGRSIDVTHVLQSACPRASGSCRVACGNHLAGDPDFGVSKVCEISFQCSTRPLQQVRVAEGGSLTLACAP